MSKDFSFLLLTGRLDSSFGLAMLPKCHCPFGNTVHKLNINISSICDLRIFTSYFLDCYLNCYLIWFTLGINLRIINFQRPQWESTAELGLQLWHFLSPLRLHYLPNKLTKMKETSFVKGQTKTNKSQEMPVTFQWIMWYMCHITHNISRRHFPQDELQVSFKILDFVWIWYLQFNT